MTSLYDVRHDGGVTLGYLSHAKSILTIEECLLLPTMTPGIRIHFRPRGDSIDNIGGGMEGVSEVMLRTSREEEGGGCSISLRLQ